MLAVDIARALGVPVANVEQNLPHMLNALQQERINSHLVRVGVLATIGTEVPNFAPIPEYAGGWEYEGRGDLGNLYPGDGPRYKGRGFIQLTGRANYRTYGARLGLPLEANPDLALDARIAARVLAVYFVDRGIPAMCAAQNWYAVRVAVNGGTNGWGRFMQCVSALENLHDETVPVVTRTKVETLLYAFPDLKSAPIHNHDGSGHPIHIAAGTSVILAPEETPHWQRVTASTYTGWVLKEHLTI